MLNQINVSTYHMMFDIYNSLIWFVAVSTYQRVEEIILQSHGRPRSSGSESCGSANDRTVVRPADQPDRPTSASSTRQNNGGFPAMTSTPGGLSVLEISNSCVLKARLSSHTYP